MQRDQKTTRTPRPSMSGGPSTVSIHPSIHPSNYPSIYPSMDLYHIYIDLELHCLCQRIAHNPPFLKAFSAQTSCRICIYNYIYIHNPSLSNHNPGLQNPIFIGEPSFFAAYNETKDCLQHRNPQRERNTYFYSIYIIHL